MGLASFSKTLAALSIGAVIGLSSASAETGIDSAAFQKIIKQQMNAFASGNAAKAFSYATGSLQRRFQTPEFFMEMVRQGYQPVYKPKSVSFGRSKITNMGPTQEVFVKGPKGKDWVALYSFEQQSDGSWRISGCYLKEMDGFAA